MPKSEGRNSHPLVNRSPLNTLLRYLTNHEHVPFLVTSSIRFLLITANHHP